MKVRTTISFVIFGIAFTASGCASYSSTSERPPLVDISSDKDPATYLGCLEPAFVEIWPQAKTIRDGAASVVMVAVGSNVPVTVRIESEGDGSRVQYRQLHDLNFSNFKKARNAVIACK